MTYYENFTCCEEFNCLLILRTILSVSQFLYQFKCTIKYFNQKLLKYIRQYSTISTIY